MKKQSKTIILTRKVEIYVNQSDKELKKANYKILRDYSYHSRHMANDIMNVYSSNLFLDKLKKENSNIKTIQEAFVSKRGNSKSGREAGGVISHTALGYSVTAEKYADLLPSFIRASLAQKVYKDFKNNIKDVLSGKKTFSSYKKDNPIFFIKSAFVELKKEEDKNFSFNLFKIPFKTRLGRDRSNNQVILDNILNNTYALCDSAIQFKDNKLFLIITFKQEIALNTEKLDENKTLGVDLGIVFPAYVSIFGTPERKAIGNSKDFLNQRTKISSRRRYLQKNLVQTSGGHGRHNKLKKLEHLSQVERNFANTYNHTVSKQVVDFALKNQCKYINIENLEGIARDEKSKFILRNWSYFELVSQIKYKSEKYGIILRVIDSAFTSQRCSKCGHIHQDNRIEQEKFICMSCGFIENADFNASQNISIAYTESFINQIQEHKKTLKENSDIVSMEEIFEETKKPKKL